MNNISIGLPKRKQFTIDNDESRIVEIDTTDTGIIERWQDTHTFFENVQTEIAKLGEELGSAKESVEAGEHELFNNATAHMKQISADVRKQINYLFDADVCTPFVGANGSMIRVVNGEPIFTTIINALLPLYEKDIAAEMQKTQKRIGKHVNKYAK